MRGPRPICYNLGMNPQGAAPNRHHLVQSDSGLDRTNIARTSRFSVMGPAYGGGQSWQGRLARILFGALAAFLVLNFDYPAGLPSGAEFDHGTNAVWLGAAWSNSLKSPEEIAGMVDTLDAHGIRYVYTEEGALEPDGKLPRDNFMYAGSLPQYLHRARQPMQALAWIGGQSIHGGGKLDLGDATVRGRIVDTAKYFVEQLDYDGVHLDIEPVPSGDKGFLALLDEIRLALGTKTISVASMKWTPVAPSIAGVSLIPYSWDSDYYVEVAHRANQVVLMSYDSGIPFANLYIKYVGWQTAHLIDTLSDVPQCDVLIGVPTYDAHTFWHSGGENIGSGLQGVIDSLRDMRHSGFVPPNFRGVALFEADTTDEAEWQTFDKIWHAPRRAP
jgi:hypothetical protein